MCPMSEPRLPADLERAIFELAAHEDPPTALRIILVAQRACAWIEPLLYRTLVLCQSSWRLPLLLRTLDAYPARCAAWVKALHIAPYIAPNDPCITRVLSLCPRAESFVDRSYGRTPFAVLAGMRLRRLCTALDTIDGLDFSMAGAFARLTHLHLLDAPARWAAVPFASLPALTHLALQNYKVEIRAANVPVLRRVLEECPRLRVLAVFVPLCRPEDENASATKRMVGDERFVILPETMGSSWELWAADGDGEATQKLEDGISYRACTDTPRTTKTKTRRRNKQTSKGGVKNSSNGYSL